MLGFVMGIDELLTTLKDLNLKLESDGQHLRIKGDVSILTSALKNALKQHKPELLKIFCNNAIVQSVSVDCYPASYNQINLWHAHQTSVNKSLYNISSETQIKGELKKAIIQQCFEKIVLRHDTLRSVFSVGENSLMVKVLDKIKLDFSYVDLSDS